LHIVVIVSVILSAGIAPQNKNKYQAYVADCKTASGDGNKLYYHPY
jgi:hypothetical protein